MGDHHFELDLRICNLPEEMNHCTHSSSVENGTRGNVSCFFTEISGPAHNFAQTNAHRNSEVFDSNKECHCCGGFLYK
jgi:hypothetical protein